MSGIWWQSILLEEKRQNKMLEHGYVVSDFEEKILFEMIRDGWYKEMTNHQKKEFYVNWWSKRLNS